jgi:hypothetical protein
MLGVLMLQTRFPRPLGDIGNAASFSFPVVYRVVAGATPQRVVHERDVRLLQPFIEAAHALVHEGALAISTSCGFLALWQAELQAAMPVPLWSSSLLQLAQLPPRSCGVITIDAQALTPAHLLAVGADPGTPIEGITPGSPLHQTLLRDLPELDSADAQAQVISAGQRLLAREPQLQALLLECTNLPPYAAALRAACGVPVHDVCTMLEARMQGLTR